MKLSKQLRFLLIDKIVKQTRSIKINKESKDDNEVDKFGFTVKQKAVLSTILSNQSYAESGIMSSILVKNPNALYSELSAYVSSLRSFKIEPKTLGLPPLCAVFLKSSTGVPSLTMETVLVVHGIKGFIFSENGAIDIQKIDVNDEFEPAVKEQVVAMVDAFTDAQVKAIIQQKPFEDLVIQSLTENDLAADLLPDLDAEVISEEKKDEVAF